MYTAFYSYRILAKKCAEHLESQDLIHGCYFGEDGVVLRGDGRFSLLHALLTEESNLRTNVFISLFDLKNECFAFQSFVITWFLASFFPGLLYFITDIYPTSSFSSNYIKTLFNGSWGCIRKQPTKLKTKRLINKRLGKSYWHGCSPQSQFPECLLSFLTATKNQ